MPDKKYVDPFKPQQPQIPGVAVGKRAEETVAPLHEVDGAEAPQARGKTAAWIAGFGVAIVFCGLAFVWHAHSGSFSKPEQSVDLAAEPPLAASDPSAPAEALPVGPGPVATISELSAPWSAKRFLFRNPLTSQTTPAVVVHLPQGAYWGISLREPFGKCDLEFITDTKKLQEDYNYQASYPMVVNPCNRTVFELSKYGSAPGGLVRGEVVQGPSIRPPLAIEISTRGNHIIAVRSE